MHLVSIWLISEYFLRYILLQVLGLRGIQMCLSFHMANSSRLFIWPTLAGNESAYAWVVMIAPGGANLSSGMLTPSVIVLDTPIATLLPSLAVKIKLFIPIIIESWCKVLQKLFELREKR